MATTTAQIASILDALELRHRIKDDGAIIVGFGDLDNYRNRNGEDTIVVVIRLNEGGEHVSLFAPGAYSVPEREQAAWFALAALGIQWRTKLIKFEYDQSDGEVRPTIEVILEDGVLTHRMLARALKGLVRMIDQTYPIIRNAIDNGVVAFDQLEAAQSRSLSHLLEGVPPAVLSEALWLADTHRTCH